jgi:UDP-N-acetylmuramate dehydrogenase
MFEKGIVAASIREIVPDSDILLDEPMKNHTSLKVGGPADIMVLPRNEKSLTDIVKHCGRWNIPFYVMGNGTNFLVRDKGLRGVVLKTTETLKEYSVDGNIISCSAGVLLSLIANVAMKAGLGGLEFASGIPGTLGGAVAMNAGAYDGEMKDIVVKSSCIDEKGEELTLEGEKHEFGYRTSAVQKNRYIVLSTRLLLKKSDSSLIKEKMDGFNMRRKQKQPLSIPSAGSVFKRPEGYYAGKLIEDCGLKGFKIGGAMVSEKHCGFIVNTGSANASDIINLINHVRHEVNKKFGVNLETEVKIIGEE